MSFNCGCRSVQVSNTPWPCLGHLPVFHRPCVSCTYVVAFIALKQTLYVHRLNRRAGSLELHRVSLSVWWRFFSMKLVAGFLKMCLSGPPVASVHTCAVTPAPVWLHLSRLDCRCVFNPEVSALKIPAAFQASQDANQQLARCKHQCPLDP